MHYIGIVGLLLDVGGVLLLGYDLVRVQRRLRGDAEDRISHLERILDEIGGIDGWAATVPNDFREWQWEEGRTVMVPDTFDARQARESFQEALETIGIVGTHVLTLSKMQMAGIDADRSTAKLSLRYSYRGLGLIVVGFCLQAATYF